MKKLLLSTAAVALMFTACKKKDDNGTGNGLGKNQFKIGGTTYNAMAVTGMGGILAGSGNNGVSDVAGFSIYFDNNALPTADGSYKIVDVANDPNELAISVSITSNGNSQAWGSTASGNPDATVKIEGGKVTVSVPEITVTGVSSETTTFSGNLTQTL